MALNDEPQQRQFGRYELLFRVGSGGMADLHLARMSGAEGFERLVAVKVIHPHLTSQPEFVKMFIDEARLASRISHPNVALTLDLGRVGATHFIAMEYIDGESFAALLRRGRPGISHCARIVSDAASGLHAAHELRGGDGQTLGVVHRDVSPQNVLISYDGAVKVVDFGVARARGSLHTTSDGFKGKFEYMAPEQFSDPRSVDRRTDVFALGIVLYEATTWSRLFKGETEADTVEKVLRGAIEPPSSRVERYPAQLEAIVMRALERDTAKRYQTAQELHEELERFIVASGEPATASSLGRMMREVFSDRISEKQTMLLSHPGSLPGAPLQSDIETRSATSVQPLVPSRRWPLVFPLVLVALAGLAVGGWYITRRAGASGAGAGTGTGTGTSALSALTTQPASQPAQRTVTITALVSPAGARLALDGEPVSNPLELQRPAGEGVVVLVASAPGHRSERQEISLATGGAWTVGLTREEPKLGSKGTKVTKGTKTTKGTKGKKGKKGTKGEEYLDNPYE